MELSGGSRRLLPLGAYSGMGKRRASRLQERRINKIYRKEMETCGSKTEMDERSNSIIRPPKETSQGYKRIVQFAATRKIAKMGPFL